ncbi:MAG: hypothetical protein OQJ95_03425 [Kangiella sp.]|nr:hypothetical protein [Kangiella sp.]MCW9029245.1 hypothetical protein [Kangiella sp.]
MSNVVREKKRLQRLRILQVVSMVRPDTLGDGLIRKALAPELDIVPGIEECRRALDYLDERGLVKVVSRTPEVWFVKVTADGTDFLDGTGPSLAGVAQPDEF